MLRSMSHAFTTHILCTTNTIYSIINYTALLGYSSQSFANPSLHTADDSDPTSPSSPSSAPFPRPASAQWFQDFRRVIGDAKVTSHEITSLLAMLSSSITNGQPLPPYLHAPGLYGLNRKLESVDPEILSLRHIAEPGYAAFAVCVLSSTCSWG